MKIVVIIARILLGLIFLVFGLNGFLHFIPSPPLTGLVAEFTGSMFASHYYILVFGVQVVTGILLLMNRYVPLAIVTLAAVLANILIFHITMYPQGLPPAIVTTILWFIVAFSLRSNFAPLLASKTNA